MRVGDPQSFNRYAYVTDDPVNFTDPTGLYREGPALIQDYLAQNLPVLHNLTNVQLPLLAHTDLSKYLQPQETAQQKTPCTFNINITNNAGLTQRQLQRMQREI